VPLLSQVRGCQLALRLLPAPPARRRGGDAGAVVGVGGGRHRQGQVLFLFLLLLGSTFSCYNPLLLEGAFSSPFSCVKMLTVARETMHSWAFQLSIPLSTATPARVVRVSTARVSSGVLSLLCATVALRLWGRKVGKGKECVLNDYNFPSKKISPPSTPWRPPSPARERNWAVEQATGLPEFWALVSKYRGIVGTCQLMRGY
jgi:hypothetical protein